MLFTYHFLVYLQNRNKVYGYYSLYVGLILIGSLQYVEFGFFKALTTPIQSYFILFEAFFRWMYNCVYFLFAFGFIELSKYSKKWDKIIKYPVYVLLAVGIVIQIISLWIGDHVIMSNAFSRFFIPLIFIHSIIGYYVLFYLKTPLRIYIIVGSLFLFVTSMTGAILYYMEILPKDNHLRDSIFYLGVVVENIFFALGIGYKQNYIRKEKNKQILNEKAKGLKAILETQEKERSQIAKDLHDSVVQKIGAINIILNNVPRNLDQEANIEINKAKKMAVQAAEDTRQISHQMMPKVLDLAGLIPALDDVIDFIKKHKIKVNLDSFNLKKRYPRNVEITMYRIFQELTNNIIKHSEATEVSVQLYEQNAVLFLLVEDNGIGISDDKTKGIGLYNIDSRLSIVHGKINYNKSPKGGTVSTIQIPLDSETEELKTS